MTDTDANRDLDKPRVIDNHEPPADPKRTGPMGSIAGADRAALGVDARAESAPEGAQVDPTETDIPGPHFADHPATAEKPWETSFATKSDDAGIGAEADPAGEV